MSIRAVPYEGQVGAGRLLPFVPKDGVIELPVPDSIPQNETLGTMTVNGSSLERVGIFDGDIVLVRRLTSKRQIKRNTICVVYVASTGEVLAKKITFEEDYLVLHSCGMQPEPPLYVLAGEAEIRGMVISATRQMADWHYLDEVVGVNRVLNTSAARAKKVAAVMAALVRPVDEDPF